MSKNKGTAASGKLRASHILMQKHSLLLEVKSKLDAGGDFRQLALQFSECPSKKKGGDLGEFSVQGQTPHGKLDPVFVNAVKVLKVGEVSDLVKTQFGWHIIKRTG
jgi:parvulin-like peptidyl-prolyl isomerase